jgi:GAF domain-containing protein
MVHIGGRRQVPDNAARIARNLGTISRCNRALFQACDEQELLQSICRILVETAQIGLAWIGYCEDDAEKTVRPRASAGDGLGYLARIDHSWGLTRAGEGPVGKAIRTGRRCWVEDIRTEPIFSNGRTEAIALGYVSCLALPLVAATPTGTPLNLHGALTLYRTAHASFDESEIGRYEDLASYLTCTIARLRSHLALRQSEEQLRLAIDTVPTLVWSCAPRRVP